MTRTFSIRTVLRMVPNPLLQQFFLKLVHEEFSPNLATLKEREIEPISAFLDEISKPKLDMIESVLHGVSDLACDSGANVIQEAAEVCGVLNLGAIIPEELSIWGRTMWVWLHHRDVFEKAQNLHKVEQLAWWRKRNDLPSNAPNTSTAAIENLESLVAQQLRQQGRAKDCSVEWMNRGDVYYFFVHPDDFVQNVTVHDLDGQLSPTTFRQTMLIVFAYHKADGSLELNAKGISKPIKEHLEVIFAKAIMNWDLPPFDPEAAYELDHLKDPFFLLETDPADRIRVRIRKMRLSSAVTGRRITIEVDDDDLGDDIHQTIEECINLENTPLSDWHVTQVNLSIEFLELDGRKPGRQSFDVGYPRSCGLRNARPERVEIIQRYLKRWKIDLAQSAEPAVLAVGS